MTQVFTAGALQPSLSAIIAGIALVNPTVSALFLA
jgi:hypothetical protein